MAARIGEILALLLVILAGCAVPTPPLEIAPMGPKPFLVRCTDYPSHYGQDFRNLGEDKFKLFGLSSDREYVGTWDEFEPTKQSACEDELHDTATY